MFSSYWCRSSPKHQLWDDVGAGVAMMMGGTAGRLTTATNAAGAPKCQAVTLENNAAAGLTKCQTL